MNAYTKKISLAALLSILSACASYPQPYYASYPRYRSNYVIERDYYRSPVYRGGYIVRNFYGYGWPRYSPPYYWPNRGPYYRPYNPIAPWRYDAWRRHEYWEHHGHHR